MRYKYLRTGGDSMEVVGTGMIYLAWAQSGILAPAPLRTGLKFYWYPCLPLPSMSVVGSDDAMVQEVVVLRLVTWGGSLQIWNHAPCFQMKPD